MDTYLDFSDLLIRPRPTSICSRKIVDLKTKFKFKYSPYELTCVPVMAANMDTVGTIGVMKELVKENLFTCLHKFITVEDVQQHQEFLKGNLDHFAFTIGWNTNDILKLHEFKKIVNFKVICIDIANGYIDNFVSFCAAVRREFPDKIIIAGNVCTEEGVMNLVNMGKVDIVKCGIGGGSACTTRVKTGVGIPQFSCVAECSDAAQRAGAMMISDGGITCPGDLGKAFGAGADFVMIGGQFAGHKENPGELIEEDGRKFKAFYGMSSTHAMKKNYGEKSTYRTSEGRYIKIPYKGEIKDTVEDFLGGLRSTCTYVDCATVSELKEKIQFIRVNNQYNGSLVR